MTTRLSVLDLSPVPSGSSPSTALRNSVDLAVHAEALGFHRHWFAEHHNAGALACSAPEILIAAAAQATKRIRVGAGGIMLPNHAPLKVAEVFRVLAALHPGRIDLGVGRAAGTDPKTALVLRQARELLDLERFPTQLEELLGFLERESDPTERFAPTKAVPLDVPSPPVFLLASGREGAELAGARGLSLAYAHHFSPDGFADAIAAYRAAFVPSGRVRAPYVVVATAAICAEDDASAEELVRCAALSFLRFGQGLRDLPFPSVDEARAYRFDADEEALADGIRTRVLAGSPERVADGLRAIAEAVSADELMITTALHDHRERKRSYERIARALGR